MKANFQAAISLIVLLFSCTEVRALSKDDLIDTNRPSFCQSSLIVPKGTLQLENGTLYQKFQNSANYFDIPETQVRLGALKRLEVQMFVPQEVIFKRRGESYNGASGLGEAGCKFQLIDVPKFHASLVAAANIPTGRKAVSGTAVQPVFRLPYTIQLTDKTALCGMQSLILMNNAGDLQWQPFVMLSRNIGDRASIFAEYAGYFIQNQNKPSQQLLHFGGVYKFKKVHQVDFECATGLTRTSPSFAVGVGYSYRFDHLPW